MNFNKISVIVLVTIIVVLGVILKTMEDKVQNLNSQNTLLQTRVHEQNLIITDLNNNFRIIQNLQTDLSKKLNSNEVQIQQVQVKLDSTLSKLDNVMQKKPTLVQMKINKATQKVTKCFEKLSSGVDCE